MVSKENVSVHHFPKNAQEAIAFEYMKRRTSESNATVEDMAEIYLRAKHLAEESLRGKSKASNTDASGWK